MIMIIIIIMGCSVSYLLFVSLSVNNQTSVQCCYHYCSLRERERERDRERERTVTQNVTSQFHGRCRCIKSTITILLHISHYMCIISVPVAQWAWISTHIHRSAFRIFLGQCLAWIYVYVGRRMAGRMVDGQVNLCLLFLAPRGRNFPSKRLPKRLFLDDCSPF